MDYSSDDETMSPGIEDQDVVTKYKMAADVTNAALKFVMDKLEDGKKIADLCEEGDNFIVEKLSGVFAKKKDIEKGLGFPTSISVNHCVGHFAPLQNDDATLKNGDIVKIDLGAHIDGYAALGAHTTVVGGELTGPAADVVAAAYTAADAAVRLCRPGNKNSQVTEVIGKVAEDFGVNVVEGVLSHEMKRYIVDGNKCIMNKSDPERQVEEWEFNENEVYAIDIVMSTGEGKPKDLEGKPLIYKRAMDQSYNLKMKASRQTLSEINKKFSAFPFPLRALDEKSGRLGITECLKHDLIVGYPTLFEKDGDIVAHFKCTVLVTPTSILKITGLEPPAWKTDKEVKDEVVKTALATSMKKKKKSGKKK